MKGLPLLICILFFVATHMSAQVPESCHDSYCNAVRQLERGDTALDYAAFRYSFIESRQFKQAKQKSAALNDLLLTAERYWHLDDPGKVVSTLREALRIDYTSMAAHSRIRRAYLQLGDTAAALRHKAIEFGLLRSILAGGNGRSCATAWPVIQIEEEYFILEMLHARLQRQSTVDKGGFCDKMETLQEGNEKVYYFEVTKVFDAYDK